VQTTRSTRVCRAPVTFKPQARQSCYDRYNHIESLRTTRDALVKTKVRKFCPGYGTFNGIIISYYPITDSYHMLFEDDDEETDSYDKIQKYLEGTSQYEQAHNTALALTVSLDSAIALIRTCRHHDAARERTCFEVEKHALRLGASSHYLPTHLGPSPLRTGSL
jgi:hypothetical protein